MRDVKGHFAALVAALVALVALDAGCVQQSARRPRIDRFSDAPLVPVGRSDIPRSGKVTYRISSLEQSEGGQAFLDIDLMNGSARGFRSANVVVTFLGRDGASKRVRRALGPLFEGATERVVVRSTLDFDLEDVQVAVQMTM